MVSGGGQFVVHAALVRLSPPLHVDCDEVVSRRGGVEEAEQLEVRRWERKCQEVGDKLSSKGKAPPKALDLPKSNARPGSPGSW